MYFKLIKKKICLQKFSLVCSPKINKSHKSLFCVVLVNEAYCTAHFLLETSSDDPYTPLMPLSSYSLIEVGMIVKLSNCATHSLLMFASHKRTDTQTDRQTNRKTHRHTHTYLDRRPDRQTDSHQQTDRYTYIQTDRQTPTNRQTHR